MVCLMFESAIPVASGTVTDTLPVRQRATLLYRGAARDGDLKVLAVIVLVGAILRFATLGVQSVWTDEALTATYLGGSVKHLLVTLPTGDANPPLFYLLEWVFVRMFGQGDAGLRVLSAVAGTLTLPVLYAIGASIGARRAGLIAAALGAVQPMLWWYSQEARVYALFVFLSALALLALVVAVRDRSTWALALWTLVSALMLTTHYFSLFLLAPQAVWLLAAWGGARREVLLALVGLAVVAVALSVTFALELGQPGFAHLPLGPRVRVLVPQLIASPSPPASALWIGALALVLFGAARALLWATEQQRILARNLAALAAWDILAPVLAAVAGKDYIVTRNLIGVLIPALVLVGIGLALPRAPRVGATGAALTAAVWLGTIIAIVADPALQRIDIKAAAASLGPPTLDRIVLSPGSYLFGFTLPRYVTPTSPFGPGKIPLQEIDVLVPHPGRGTQPCLAGQTCQLFATHQRTGPPAAGFRLVSERLIEPFTVLRWRAAAPTPLQLSDLVASAPQAEGIPPIVLYQRAQTKP